VAGGAGARGRRGAGRGAQLAASSWQNSPRRGGVSAPARREELRMGRARHSARTSEAKGQPLKQ